MEIKKGTLIRNKSDGQYAIVISEPFTKFFPEEGQMEYGEADTAVRIKWMSGGYERTIRKRSMKWNWEVLSEG